MKLLLANHSSYPRIGGTRELQQLRRTIAAWERKEANDETLHAAQNALVHAAIKEQEEAGLDVLTDGLIRWYDPISHLAGKMDGIEISGLLRFFDTNSYFRQPVAKAAIQAKNGLTVPEFEFATTATQKPVKAVLTGPYTLARHTIAEHAPYKQIGPLTHAYAEVLAKEIAALAERGCQIIQLDEPAILKHRPDFSILQRAVQFLSRHKGKATLSLAVYFGDPQPLYERLQSFPSTCSPSTSPTTPSWPSAWWPWARRNLLHWAWWTAATPAWKTPPNWRT